jgi:hypothetical protein
LLQLHNPWRFHTTFAEGRACAGFWQAIPGVVWQAIPGVALAKQRKTTDVDDVVATTTPLT